MAMASSAGGVGQPIIEVGGKLQFSLPGQPIFPALADDTILKPAFDWILYSAQPARFDGELSYVSGGMSWSSDYNIVAPETGDTRSEEHTSELQSLRHLVCRLLLEKKKKRQQ